jgi:hypothetical protein
MVFYRYEDGGYGHGQAFHPTFWRSGHNEGGQERELGQLLKIMGNKIMEIGGN